MKDNGTDRDVALLILSGLDSCATLVASINDNLYVPHITTQPVDQTGAIGADIEFSLTAINVKSYQWQFTASGTEWNNSTFTGNQTDTMTVPVTAPRYGYSYRCMITGKDDSIIYSDVVHIINPDA